MELEETYRRPLHKVSQGAARTQEAQAQRPRSKLAPTRQGKVFPQRHIPLRLSAAHLDPACRLPDSLHHQRAEPSLWEVGRDCLRPRLVGLPVSPACTSICIPPSGHGVISASGIYQEVEKKRKSTKPEPMCVPGLMGFLLASGQHRVCSLVWAHKCLSYL